MSLIPHILSFHSNLLSLIPIHVFCISNIMSLIPHLLSLHSHLLSLSPIVLSLMSLISQILRLLSHIFCLFTQIFCLSSQFFYLSCLFYLKCHVSYPISLHSHLSFFIFCPLTHVSCLTMKDANSDYFAATFSGDKLYLMCPDSLISHISSYHIFCFLDHISYLLITSASANSASFAKNIHTFHKLFVSQLIYFLFSHISC